MLYTYFPLAKLVAPIGEARRTNQQPVGVKIQEKTTHYTPRWIRWFLSIVFVSDV